MHIDLTRDQRALVQKAIESGRFEREEQAVEEALVLWEKRERRRVGLLAMIDEAEASLARGEGREITKESMKALADEINSGCGVASLNALFCPAIDSRVLGG